MTEKLELLHLLWVFLRNQPPEHWLALAPWHLLSLLGALGLLAAFGLHFLVGYGLRFYRVNRPVARFVSVPMAVLWLLSVQLLLGAYLLSARAPALLQANLAPEISPAPGLGAYLLEPGLHASGRPAGTPLSKLELLNAVNRVDGESYREFLRQHRVPPGTLTAPLGKGTGLDTQTALEQLGLQWLTDPDQNAPPLIQSEEPVDGEAPVEGLFLPDLVARLLGDLRDEDTLAPANWEYVAGTRFVSELLTPVVEEYLLWLGAALAMLVLLVDALLILLIARLKRVWTKRPAPQPVRTASSAKPAMSPAAASPGKPATPAAVPSVGSVAASGSKGPSAGDAPAGATPTGSSPAAPSSGSTASGAPSLPEGDKPDSAPSGTPSSSADLAPANGKDQDPAHGVHTDSTSPGSKSPDSAGTSGSVATKAGAATPTGASATPPDSGTAPAKPAEPSKPGAAAPAPKESAPDKAVAALKRWWPF